MKDWDEVKKNKELLGKVEDLVNEAADYYDDLPEEICSQLNELTGNCWEPGDYAQYCSGYWETPWDLRQVVYALFHDGKMPELNEFELHIVKTSEKIDMTRIEIGHALCTAQYDDAFRNKFQDLPEKEIEEWFTGAFDGWKKKRKEEADNVTPDEIEYGEITCIFTCQDELEYPLKKRVGVTVSHDRTAFVWGKDLSDKEKKSIENFFVGIGCIFLDE